MKTAGQFWSDALASEVDHKLTTVAGLTHHVKGGHRRDCELALGQRTGSLLGLPSVSYITTARRSVQVAAPSLPTCDYVESLDYNSQATLLHGSPVQQVSSHPAQILL